VAALAPGDSASALVTFDVPDDYAGELCNSALVGSGALDPDITDNEQQACGPVVTGPAAPRPPAPPATSPPTPPVSVIAQCQSRRHFTIRLREHGKRVIRSAQVRVRGRRVAVLRRHADGRWVATIDLRGLPLNTYRVQIAARFRNGARGYWVRNYRTCIKPRPPANRLRNRHAL
jgi:hypothetical protein